MERDPLNLPVHLARLVQKANAADLAEELENLLAEGRRNVTVGLGPGVDLPLLDEELYAADVALLDRELVVATIRAEPDGYVVERGWSNFGVYTWSELEPGWTSVPHMGQVRGLRPGDKLALGSTPADSLRFRLPDSSLVPPPTRRGTRGSEAARTRVPRSDTPPTLDSADSLSRRTPLLDARRTGRTVGNADARRTPGFVGRSIVPDGSGRMGTPPGLDLRPAPTGPTRRRLPAERTRFQRRFEHAMRHWHYAMVTVGTDEDSVIHLDDPELDGLRLALSRNLSHPERGYDLFVKNPGPDLWLKEAGEALRHLGPGDVMHLVGPGHRIGFTGYVVELPTPVMPVPRFTSRDAPTLDDIAEILGVAKDQLDRNDVVESRYLDLVERFHPDRHSGDPGDLSRFLEIKLCFDAWRALRDTPNGPHST